MVNQNTPYGNLKYTQTGTSNNGNPTYTASIDLSPTGQKLLDYSNQTQLGLGQLQGTALGTAQNVLSKPMDLSSVKDIEDQSYANQTARLDPQWKQNDEAQAAQLANQGITQGSEAYNNAMRTYGQTKNDAYTQARLAALSTAPQTYQLATATRNQPLNELSAIMTGSQVQNPSFVSTPQQQATPGANMLGAAQAQGQFDQANYANQMGLYNSQVGQNNSMMGGIFGLGGALGSAALTKYSDRRLKSQIRLLRKNEIGVGIYEYVIAGIRQIGVMADEVLRVRPEAVETMPSGYMKVNYEMVGSLV